MQQEVAWTVSGAITNQIRGSQGIQVFEVRTMIADAARRPDRAW